MPPEDGSHRNRPRLEIVGAGDPDVVARLGAGPLVPSFAPVADLTGGLVIAYEVALGRPGDLAVAPREWSRRAPAAEAGAVEARILREALGHRDRVPAGFALLVSFSDAGFSSAQVQEELGAAESLAGLWLAIRCEGDRELRPLRAAVSAVRRRGATVVLDEAAVDYLALRRLVRLRPDAIRIGPDFVEELDRDIARSAVVETLVALARRIGARVIAEGVSSASELCALAQLGVSAASGPLFGDSLGDPGPLPLGAVAAMGDAAGAARSRPGTVASLVESTPTLPVGATLGQLADAFLEDARSDFVVLVDDEAKPARMVERSALLRAEPYEREALAVSGQTGLRTVARRAAARSPYERFVPVVCTDARGRVVGVVRVDRLLDALAAAD
jgi:EAL domain-containing protein (putative c-di-GMP-specific phosphodiesterase class I)